MTQNTKSSIGLFAIALVSLAALSRFIPHPFNFTAIGAMALFAGANFKNKKLAYLLPVFAMILTDLYFGLHFSILPVYFSFVLTVWLGTRMNGKVKASSIFKNSLVSSVLFFLITNLPFWYADLSLYTLDLKGTLLSYSMALPFFTNQLIGDLFYNGLMFGCFYLIKKSQLRLTPQDL